MLLGSIFETQYSPSPTLPTAPTLTQTLSAPTGMLKLLLNWAPWLCSAPLSPGASKPRHCSQVTSHLSGRPSVSFTAQPKVLPRTGLSPVSPWPLVVTPCLQIQELQGTPATCTKRYPDPLSRTHSQFCASCLSLRWQGTQPLTPACTVATGLSAGSYCARATCPPLAPLKQGPGSSLGGVATAVDAPAHPVQHLPVLAIPIHRVELLPQPPVGTEAYSEGHFSSQGPACGGGQHAVSGHTEACCPAPAP